MVSCLGASSAPRALHLLCVFNKARFKRHWPVLVWIPGPVPVRYQMSLFVPVEQINLVPEPLTSLLINKSIFFLHLLLCFYISGSSVLFSTKASLVELYLNQQTPFSLYFSTSNNKIEYLSVYFGLYMWLWILLTNIQLFFFSFFSVLVFLTRYNPNIWGPSVVLGLHASITYKWRLIAAPAGAETLAGSGPSGHTLPVLSSFAMFSFHDSAKVKNSSLKALDKV